MKLLQFIRPVCLLLTWNLAFLISSCQASPVGAVASLYRKLNLNGFHRELVTSVGVVFKESVKKPCRIVLQEDIPAGIYLNLDEIESLQSWEEYQLVSSEVFNTEQPKHLSHAVSVVIYKNLEKINDKELNASVTLPVHLRYHQVSDKENFAQITIPNPQVLIRCDDSGEEQHNVNLACDKISGKLCKWHKITVRSDTKSLTAQIPTGRSKHYTMVLLGTQVVSVITTLSLLQLMYSQNVGFEDSKIK